MIEVGIIKDTPVNKIIDIRDKNQIIKAKYAIGKDDILKYTLMAEHYIEISFELNRNASFKRSDYIEWEGDKYTLRDDYQPEQINKRKYKYTLKFEAVEMFFQDMQYWYLGQGLKESELRMTGNPEYFLKYAVENANRYFKTTEFNIGTVEPTEIKDITFEVNTNTFNALTQIADVYGAEWYITGKTIHLLNKVSFGDEVDFETEVSVLSMKREEGESTTRYTRILALGSTRNIPYDYRETTPNEAVDAVFPKRLRIPASKGDVIDAYSNMSPDEVVEGTVIFDEVYPKRVGTIEAVGTLEYQDVNEDTGEVTKWNAYKFKDSGINFKEEYMLPGQELKLQFVSGDLNGRDFALKFHPKGFSSSDNSQFYEIYRTDEFGKLLPNDVMKPKAGDKYVLYGFNIALVSDQYVPAGELELYDVAVEWQKKQLRDTGVYECPTVIKHFKDNQMDLAIGQKVRLIKDIGSNRNLLLNSAFSKIESPWSGQGTHSVSVDSANKYNGYNSLKVVATAGGEPSGLTNRFLTIRSGVAGDHLFSFYAKADQPRTLRVRINDIIESFTLTTEWQRFIRNKSQPDAHIVMWLASAGTMWMACPQIEAGNKATAWNPAPEDIDNAIRSSRIMGFEKKLNNKFDAIYTVGDNSTYSRFGKIEQQIKELQVAGIVYESTGGNGVYVIKQFDTTRPTDFNVYSAQATDAKYFNKQTGGAVQGDTTFTKNMQVQGTAIGNVFQNSTFTAGQFGSGFQIKRDANGQSYMEVDNLLVRRETVFNRLTIAEIKSVGGTILLSLASMVLSKVEVKASTWKCFFDTADGTIPNDYAVGDQAICRKFTGKDIKYYWALITAVGVDYIELSRTDKDGSGVPTIGDEVVQLGNRNDVNRQYAIMLSAYGSAAPSINQYAGINSYDLTGKEVTAISPKGNKFTGSFTVSTNGTTAPIYKERGAFINGTTYYLNDRVSYLGSYWVCVVNSTITTPNEGSSTWRKDTIGQNDIDKVDQKAIQAKTDASNAQSTADKAQTDANKANSVISDIANDNKLTPNEKQIIAKDWGDIQKEYPSAISEANKFGISTTAYTNAYNALNSYITPLLADLTTTNDIVGTTFRLRFNTYRDEYVKLLNAIASKTKELADAAQTSANNAQSTANQAKTDAANAQSAASKAQTDADGANSLLADIASDNKFVPNEKQETKKEWDIIVSEYTKNIAQANKFSVSTTAYTTDYNALSGYITPLLANLGTTSAINGATFRANFKAYYDARTDLLNAISTNAKDLADAAQTTANNAQTTAEKVRTEYKADFVVLDTKIASKVSQTDFNALGNRVSTAESEIIQQAGKIESIVTKVGNMSIGSDNLLTNSAFIGIISPWQSDGSHFIVLDNTEKYEGINSLKCVSTGATTTGGTFNRFFAAPSLAGDITMSFYAKADKAIKLNVRIGSFQPSNTTNITTFNISTSWQLYTTQTTKANGNAIVCWLESAVTLWMAKPMVVNGNTVPTWAKSSKDVELIADAAQSAANKAQQDADKAKQDATNAQSTANQAQTEANKANSYISDIASDNKLTPSEKKEIQREWNEILAEYPKNASEASNYSISSVAYTTAYNTLDNYIIPLLSDLNTTSDIVGGTMRQYFKNYYETRSTLLNAIAAKAKELADAAQSSANNAQTTADSKNRTYYQDAVPPAPSGGHKVGDLWYKVSFVDSSGNINADTSKNIYQLQYRWDGTTWRQINWSVSKSKIEQTDSSISLIVEKTGLNSVGAGSSLFSMIKQTEDKIVLEVSKVEVGATNLLLNSAFSKIESPWSGQGTHSVSVDSANKYNGYNSLKVVATAGGEPSGLTNRFLTIRSGVAGDHLFSFYAKADQPRTLRVRINDIIESFTLTTEWQRFIRNKSQPDAHIVMWLASAGTMWMACPQIEAGNKVTSWRPAPEDTQAGIDNVQNTADQAKTIADSAQITANVAKTDSATANSKLADIASDNKFTPSEKQETKKEWDVIVSEYPKNTAQADKFGISRSTYSWVSDALNIYITPLLANLNTTSDIDGATFRAKFKSYYDARTDLLNAISSKAKELADSKTTLNEVKAGLSVTADGVTIFGDKFTVDSLLIANAIKTNSLDVGGGNFHVGRDGVLSAKGAYIEGRLAIPFVDPLLSNNQVINLDEYFNISTSSYLYPNTTLYLPSNLKYNGVTCNIYNKGMTGNNTNIVIKPTSGTLIKTFGVDSNSFKSSIQIELGGLATFYAILENNRLIWICTNYPGAINTIS